MPAHDNEDLSRDGAGRMRTHVQFRVREATSGDLRAMARLHRLAYSRDHFLAMLPEEVLADYYGRFLGDGSHTLVAIADPDRPVESGEERLLGFAVFGRDIERRIAVFKRARRLSIAGAALRHPALSFRKLLVAVQSWGRGDSLRVEAPALLLSIAVDQSVKGVGSALLEHLLRWSASAGEGRVGLYVRHRNVRAINAYLRAGFGIRTSIADQYYMEWVRVAE